MVKVSTLLVKQSPLNERDEIKQLISHQLLQQLEGGYIGELIKDGRIGNYQPEQLKKVVVGKSLIGSGHQCNQVKCNICHGSGLKLNRKCHNCHGSGLMDWINSGVNFISSFFKSKDQNDMPPEDYSNDPNDEQPSKKPSFNKPSFNQQQNDPDFLVHGYRKTELLKELGLPSNATKADVRATYLKLSRKYHPDKGGNPEMFKHMNNLKTELIGGEIKKSSSVGTKEEVWNGLAKHTSGGLKKSDLMQNKRGKIISKKQFEAGQRAYENIEKYRK